MGVGSWVLTIIAVVAAIPCAVVLIECLASLLPPPRRRFDRAAPRPTVAVLTPAHNEQGVLTRTIASVKPQLTERDRHIVIADNCTDGTATEARQAGAVALERHDAEHRGKGYALAFGVEYLRADPPQVVIIIDADMHVHEGSIDVLARTAAELQRPVQALDLLAPPDDPSPRDRISSFAFTFRNHVRPAGLRRLGLPCMLMGTGMALPWELISRATLATGNIVEDMQLGIDLAAQGHPAEFCPEAKVTGRLPKQDSAAVSQRTRWEHGHLRTLLTTAPGLIVRAMRRGQWRLAGLGLELAVPPLSLLVAMLLGLSVITALAGGFFGASWIPLGITVTSVAMVAICVLIGWAGFARHTLQLRTLLAAPLYLLWKAPVYIAFLLRPKRQWVRTERDG